MALRTTTQIVCHIGLFVKHKNGNADEVLKDYLLIEPNEKRTHSLTR